jgi:glycosyltransferase involved in cell wall biosynthesis
LSGKKKSLIVSHLTKSARVGIDFHTFDGIYQGSRSHILGLFAEAIVKAPEITFVFFLGDVDGLRRASSAFRARNVELVRMAHVPGPVRLLFQLPWLQLRHRLDLLHMQYRIPPLRVGPVACTIHDVLFESHPQYFPPGFVKQSRLTFRYSARRADLLFSVSGFSRAEIAKRYGLPEGRIAVIYNGVDGGRFFPGQEGRELLPRFGLESRRYLLTVGRLEPRKNHVNLIKAYALLGSCELPLVIVGQRDFGVNGLSALIDELDLKDRIVFLDSVGDGELPALMRHARVFVYPAFAEGFGMPVLEAMAGGVPVVTSPVTSLPEVAGDGAVFADPHDPAAIAAAIARLLKDNNASAAVSEAAAKRAAMFNWSSSADVLVAAYRAFFQSRAQ